MDFAARSVLLEGEARVRLGEAFSVAGFVGRFLGVCDELTVAAPPSWWARVWMAMRSTWFQITSRAYAGLRAPPAR
jgi:hypothetical protein